MVKKKDLEIISFARLHEVREVWYKSLADWYDNCPGYGAETRVVGKILLVGLYSSEKMAREMERKRIEEIRKELAKGDEFDRARIFATHNIRPERFETSGGFDVQTMPHSVPVSEIEEIGEDSYWDRPKREKPTLENNEYFRVLEKGPVLWKYPWGIDSSGKIRIE